MKKIFIFIFLVLIAAGIVFAFPINPPSIGTTAATLNPDGSFSVTSGGTLSQVGIRSTAGGNYAMFTGPTNAPTTYSITLTSYPTNGFWLGTIDSSGTNMVLTQVPAGITQTIDVIVSGNTTNRIFISSGIITNITSL